MVNIGTPSVDSITLIQQESDSRLNQYRLQIKYHYCPDGRNDYPGMGSVNLVPLRDFTNKGVWVGGTKANYSDWVGVTDTKVLAAIRRLDIQGKIGQRDGFTLMEGGVASRYYLYEVNLFE
ncbi:unnamed protein product [Sphagnum balticum]